MHWAGGCIPECTGQGGVSQNALGREVCIPACTGQGVLAQEGVYPGGVSTQGVS